ncbi:YggS family pyridoxal phosphate-dependent enzyme [Uruburuella testudinis]|uniref:Pyridoxal phosphate homeostasis protein n=1 Tax=Uruburuella testudinis TaxID=1282863 RepID=A0ABY4DYG2_9NEIS|nr:YggS family pyridoxal phosphate-dependent enzyme [Uruburuella testudinis]UOO81711.1 YggS family pyridoxal phosphate-dependent enzyme [Uruburuella testudinis]
MANLQQNYRNVLAEIAAAEAAASRPAGSVRLVAVGKTFPAADIRAVYCEGQRDFGENYIQEWYAKTDELADCPDIVWHIIGQIQSNKTRPVAERAHWVHTIDRLKTAQRLSSQRPEHMPALQVCIEVNIAAEAAKHGVKPEEAVALACEVAKLPRLKVRGLMCVAAAAADDAGLQAQFKQMQALLTQLQAAGVAADVLSMGMTADMALAVVCGATHVRIGSAIFGQRDNV